MASGDSRITEAELKDRLVPVVLGGEILAYSYARCFNEAYGVKTVVYSSVDVRVTSTSRFTDYRVDSAFSQGTDAIMALLRRLGAELKGAGKVALLLGSADWQVRLIVENQQELSQWFIIPYNDLALYDEVTDKARFNAICEELSIPYPKTQVYDCSDAAAKVDVSAFTYPVIAKPSNSGHYDLMDFPGKKKIYEVADPAELERIFDALCDAGYRDELLVQDFIPGDDDAIVSLTTFSDDDGNMRVVSGGKVVLQDHSPARIGNPVTILLERHDQVVEDARRFLAHTGYRGFANFDAKYDSRDGLYKFFEVNARPGANTYYMALGGVNFATLLVEQFVLGHEVPYAEAYADRLFTLVPKRVIERSVPDPELRRRVLEYYRDRRTGSPFGSSRDTLAHRFWAWVRCMNQIKKFDRYVGDMRREGAR